jgi:hypothetical protein
MKKLILFLAVILLLITSCEGVLQKDINTVKNSTVELGFGSNYVVGDVVKQIAGLNGTTKWESFKPSGHDDEPNIVCVQVDITRNKEKKNSIVIQYLLNKENGFVKQSYLSVDGESISILDFYLLLAEIGIDNI